MDEYNHDEHMVCVNPGTIERVPGPRRATLPAVSSTDLLDAWERARREHVAKCFDGAPQTDGPWRAMLETMTRESFDAGFRAAVRATGA